MNNNIDAFWAVLGIFGPEISLAAKTSFQYTKAGIGYLRAGSVAEEYPIIFNNKFPESIIGDARKIPIENYKTMTQSSNYVVLEDGTLVTGNGGHISLANGLPVVAAGEFKVINGELKFIDNASGHYQPYGISAQKAAENAFKKYGFNTTNKYIEKIWVPDPTLKKRGRWVPKE